MSSNLQRLSSKDYLSLSDNSINYFEITGQDAIRDKANISIETFSDWDNNPLSIQGYHVLPNGTNNDIPNQIQEGVLPNSLAPRIQSRKAELLFGQGPYLYKQKVDGSKYFREPVEDKNITAFLESVNYEELLLNAANDWYYQTETYTKIYRSRAGRIGVYDISKLEYLEAFDCRVGYKSTDTRKKPTHVFVSDWNTTADQVIEVYPLFDPKNPYKHAVSVHRSRKKSYGMKSYTLPEIYGALEWIKRSTSIPKIFKALTENSLNIKWHIQSPAKYWEDKRRALRDNCKASKTEYQEQMLEDLKGEILSKLSTLLSGVDNVGKFWHNEYVIELVGSNAIEHGWKITPIEQKTKEYVESQILISEKADFATVAGLGLHAALGNVGADGKSHTGGEQLYAYKIHQMTSVNLPEFFVCQAINEVLRIKFKNDIKVGFYQTNPEREQDVSVKNRTVEQNPSNTP